MKNLFIIVTLFFSALAHCQLLNENAQMLMEYEWSTDVIENFTNTYDSNCGLNESSERQRRRFINESSDCFVSVMNFISSLEDGDDSMWGKQKAVISGFQSAAVNFNQVDELVAGFDFNKKLPDYIYGDLFRLEYKSSWCYIYFDLRHTINGNVSYSKLN